MMLYEEVKNTKEVKLTVYLNIEDEKRVRDVHYLLERGDTSYTDSIGKVVEDLMLNLDKLPEEIKKWSKEDDELECLGIRLIDSEVKSSFVEEEE